MIDPLRPLGLDRPAIDPVVRPQRNGRREPDEDRRGREERERRDGQGAVPDTAAGTPDDEGHLDVLS